jgi:hypothetical protein
MLRGLLVMATSRLEPGFRVNEENPSVVVEVLSHQSRAQCYDKSDDLRV